MATNKEKIVYEVEIDGKQAEKSLGGLEKRIEKLKQLREGEQIGSKAFNELSRDIQKAESAIKNVELQFESLDFEQKLTAGSDAVIGIAGGFAAAQGAAALFGAESVALEETLTKVAGALALSQGLRDLANGAIALRKLNLVKKVNIALENLQAAAEKRRAASTVASTGVTGIATAAQWLWNAALYANPVVAIVIAVAALVAGLAFLAYSLSSSTAEFDSAAYAQNALNDAIKEGNEATVEAKADLESLLSVANDNTASLKARQQAIKELNELSPQYIGNLTLENIATKEGSAAIDAYVDSLDRKAQAEAIQGSLVEKNKEILELKTKSLRDFSTEFTNAERAKHSLMVLTDGFEAAAAAQQKRLIEIRGAAIKRIEQEKDAIKGLVQIKKAEVLEDTADADAKIAAQKLVDEAAKKAEKDAQARSKARQAARQAEAKREQGIRDQEAKDFASLIIAIEKLENEAADKKLGKEQLEINAVQDKFFQTIELAKKNGLDVQELEIAQQEAIAEIRQKFADEAEEARLEDVKKLDDIAQKELDAEEAQALALKAIEDKKLQDVIDARNKKIDNAQAGLDFLNGLNNAFVKDEIKREKIRKTLAVAQIAIDTARGISAAVAAGAGLIFFFFFPAILAGVTAVLAGIGQAKAILGAGDSGLSAASITGAATGTDGAQLNNISNTASLIDQDQQNLSQPVLVVESFNEANNNIALAEELSSF